MATRNAAALGALAEWGAKFERLASPHQRGVLTKEMSKSTRAFIEEGFRRESTPHDQKWRPKQRPNGEAILIEKGRLRKSFSEKVGIGRFVISNSMPYANAHQYGYKKNNLPRRRMWPSAGRLPVKYVREYTRLFQKHAFKIIKGKGRK